MEFEWFCYCDVLVVLGVVGIGIGGGVGMVEGVVLLLVLFLFVVLVFVGGCVGGCDVLDDSVVVDVVILDVGIYFLMMLLEVVFGVDVVEVVDVVFLLILVGCLICCVLIGVGVFFGLGGNYVLNRLVVCLCSDVN